MTLLFDFGRYTITSGREMKRFHFRRNRCRDGLMAGSAHYYHEKRDSIDIGAGYYIVIAA